MPKIPRATLIWSPEHQAYLLFEQSQLRYLLKTSDDPFWFSWLDAQDSFSFRGTSGSLNLHQEARTDDHCYWYAYRRQGQRVAKKYLGRTTNLSLARLEETARALGGESISAPRQTAVLPQDQKRRRTSLPQTLAISKGEPTEIAPKRKPRRHFQPNVPLKRARLERGWSQQEVADLLEAPYAFMVARWENSTVFPGPVYRKKLCQLFRKSEAELGLLRHASPLIESAAHASLWPVC